MLNRLFVDRSLEDSDNYFKAMKAYKLDPEQRFVDVKNRIGLNASSSYAQMYFANRGTYKRFRRELDLHFHESNPLNKEYDVLLVTPPNGFPGKKETQRFIHQAMGLGTSGQFAFVSQVQINSKSVLRGAKRLFNIVEERRRKGRKLLIVSYSFGSAFVRVMIDQMQESELSIIKGWLNISGLIFGTPRYDCSDRSRWFGRKDIGERSFSMEQRYFRKGFDTRGIKTVHMLGLKNDSRLSIMAERKREFLKAFGPNDGMIPFGPYQFLNQPVVPLLDQEHFINLSGISSTYLKILSSMVSLLPQAKPARVLDPKTEIDFL